MNREYNVQYMDIYSGDHHTTIITDTTKNHSARMVHFYDTVNRSLSDNSLDHRYTVQAYQRTDTDSLRFKDTYWDIMLTGAA